MSVYVKISYEDEIAVMPDGVSVGEEFSKLSVTDESGKVVGVFDKWDRWWIGDKVRPN